MKLEKAQTFLRLLLELSVLASLGIMPTIVPGFFENQVVFIGLFTAHARFENWCFSRSDTGTFRFFLIVLSHACGL